MTGRPGWLMTVHRKHFLTSFVRLLAAGFDALVSYCTIVWRATLRGHPRPYCAADD
jgi:hypothetical protein